jgi:DNA topoisomerase-1
MAQTGRKGAQTVSGSTASEPSAPQESAQKTGTRARKTAVQTGGAGTKTVSKSKKTTAASKKTAAPNRKAVPADGLVAAPKKRGVAPKKRNAATKTAPSGTLVIVESPSKAHTIERILGKSYRVVASQGHVRDLPKTQLGVDIENGFNPQYVNVSGRASVIKDIKTLALNAEHVLLATDPDREGEAISWHIAQVLGMDVSKPIRIEFNEITQSAIQQSILSPRPIDMSLVDAQQARRVLDRLVGYKISPILWKKIRYGLSAGRVQSVAVRMICDRDREIAAFVAKEYWTIDAKFTQNGEETAFESTLERISGQKAEIPTGDAANALIEEIKGESYRIDKVKKGVRTRNAPAPFTTSTLQQEASRKLSFTPANTMRLAQQLYEGIDIDGAAVGLVTYIRTDSVRVSNEALSLVRQYIEERYGKAYLPKAPNKFANRSRAQDAHEAIRPTSLMRTPQSVAHSLSPQLFRLYELIFNRFVASQMTGEVSDTLTADIVGGKFLFRTTGSVVRFDGYRAVYIEGRDNDADEEEKRLPLLTEGNACRLCALNPLQHFTQPPPRYSEATLVKALEERGIGRPSTYASIISTIIDREYVERESRQLKATELGFAVTDWLKKNFTDIVDEEFTAQMETRLDAVEEGSNWKETLTAFYEPFSRTLDEAAKSERVKMPEEQTDIPCDLCGAMMVIKSGRFGKFLACPRFPECKNTKRIVENIAAPCPKCGAKVVRKKSKKGRQFFGCERYPQCDYVSWDEPLLEKCPVCGSAMVLKIAKNKAKYRQCMSESCDHREFVKKENDNA